MGMDRTRWQSYCGVDCRAVSVGFKAAAEYIEIGERLASNVHASVPFCLPQSPARVCPHPRPLDIRVQKPALCSLAMASSMLHRRRAVNSSGSAPADATDSTRGIKPASQRAGSGASQSGAVEFMSLPTEIHFAISKHLIYPDALSLKHTSRHFYGLVNTGVNLKVEWLIERRSLHLECPNDKRCDLGSDLRFCRGSVPLLMKRRREHMECDSRPGLGCLVFGTKTCVHRQRNPRWRRWLTTKFTIELWWVLLALVPLAFAWAWLAELIGPQAS
ncbi:hypothetical protein V2G26_015362 [Clonostachys chloroleuca]